MFTTLKPRTIAWLIAHCAALFTSPATAQRQWGLSDSTSYAIGGDTSLIASRKQLYRALPNDTVLLRDFAVADEPDLYIRDVDHWSSTDWYVLVGSRYIGYPTVLYRTVDAGATWFEDTSYLSVVDASSINQMSITEDGGAYLFNGYYTSEVLRSFDGGGTWEPWFNSLIAHYYGIIPCGTTAFIFGMVGDGFQPAMWQVPDSLWTLEDIQFWSGCHNGGVAGCYYASTTPYAEVVTEFQQVADLLCTALAIGPVLNDVVSLRLYPNPATDVVMLEGIAQTDVITVTDLGGHTVPVHRTGRTLDVRNLVPGVYVVSAKGGASVARARFVRE